MMKAVPDLLHETRESVSGLSTMLHSFRRKLGTCFTRRLTSGDEHLEILEEIRFTSGDEHLDILKERGLTSGDELLDILEEMRFTSGDEDLDILEEMRFTPGDVHLDIDKGLESHDERGSNSGDEGLEFRKSISELEKIAFMAVSITIDLSSIEFILIIKLSLCCCQFNVQGSNDHVTPGLFNHLL